MDNIKASEISELYKKSVQNLLDNSKINDFISKLVFDYVNNAVKFFNENRIEWPNEQSLILFIKSNAPQHLNDTLNFLINLSLDNYLAKTRIH